MHSLLARCESSPWFLATSGQTWGNSRINKLTVVSRPYPFVTSLYLSSVSPVLTSGVVWVLGSFVWCRIVGYSTWSCACSGWVLLVYHGDCGGHSLHTCVIFLCCHLILTSHHVVQSSSFIFIYHRLLCYLDLEHLELLRRTGT